MKRVYYNKEVEEFLHYQSQEQYYRDCQLLISLPTNDVILLKHFGEFMLFVEIFVANTFEDLVLSNLERAFKGMGKEELCLDVVLSIAWQWHNEMSEMTLNDRKREMTGLYANSYLLSWTGFCKLYHLSVMYDEEVYKVMRERRAKDFPYFAMIQRESNGIISPLPISQYRMTQVWDCMRQILPTLYIYTYSQEMRDYVNALFFRYCDFFCTGQKNLSLVLDNPLFMSRNISTKKNNHNGEEMMIDDGEEEEEEEEEEDDYDSYRKVSIPLDEKYSLQSEYFYEGEILFFSQLRRMRLSKRLELQHEKNPIILKEKPTKELMVAANKELLEMLCSICEHKYLRQFVVEDFKVKMMSLYVYHGEAERFRRKHPTANDGPGDVLAVCRPADQLNANNILKMKLADIINNQHKKEIVLITKCVTHRWLSYNSGTGVSRFLNDSREELQGFIIEEMVSLDTINEIITDNEASKEGMYPTLLKLVSLYYVLDGKGGIYKSDRFVDTYIVWLNLLIRGKMIQRKLLYPAVCKLLDYFVPF
jgi:hypothetical protein